LGSGLRDAGRSIVYVDANPQHCRLAEEQGFNVIYGNALQERTLQRARFELVGTAIGLTSNDSLNQQYVAYAAEHFDVPEGLAALRRADKTGKFTGLFMQPHDLERWDVRIRHDMVELENWRFAGAPEAVDEGIDPSNGNGAGTSLPGDRFVLLYVARGKRTFPTSYDYKPKVDDRATVVIYTQEREEAYADLRQRGWEPVPKDADTSSAK
jgi:voltage-gated potassium channel Kch